MKPAAARWYVIRAEQYLQAVAPQRLAEQTPQEVTDYLEKLGRIGSMEAWQYGQVVDAIQHLFLMGKVAWAQYFDWAYWKASARTLPVAHPTIAREATTVTIRGKTTQKQMGSVSLARVRDTHASSLDALLAEIRRRGYSIRTERAYESWVTRYLALVGNADPCDLGNVEVVAFLQHLAVERQVTASTQNQAFNALVFFYQYILQQPLGDLDGFIRAKRPQRLPVVLIRTEVAKLLEHMHGTQVSAGSKGMGWQYVFPSARLSLDPRSGAIRRHHVHENGLQRAVKKAARQHLCCPRLPS